MRKIAVCYACLLLLFGIACRSSKETAKEPGAEPVVCKDTGQNIVQRPAANYWVTAQGRDSNNGQTYETAFASIQKGIDALSPGQTLVIGPGEYFGVVRGNHLGNAGVNTVIRAEIPGTAILRGDISAPVFEKLPGYRWIYVADINLNKDIQAVNELDTLKLLSRAPNVDELEFSASRFYHDRLSQKLYISSSDRKAPDLHRYSLSVTDTHGLYLDAPQRVVIEGLVAAGFHKSVGVPYGEQTLWATYGIFIRNGKSCVIRNCQAYLNGRGIGSSNEYDTSAGDNLITNCKAWGNGGVGLDYDTGGIDMLYPRRDEIRDSISYLNLSNGFSIRGGLADTVSANASNIRNCLSWGNRQYDYWIKAGENINYIENCVGTGRTGNTDHLRQSVTGSGTTQGNDSIILSQEQNLDPAREFADPDNFDFRLQGSSRFIRAFGGADRGAFPYVQNIFYLAPGGNDAASGLSVDRAFGTMNAALGHLNPGDTLYLEPGVYNQDVSITISGTKEAPIVIRGRGKEPAVLKGKMTLSKSRYVEFERLHFSQDVMASDCEAISFNASVFSGHGTALTADSSTDIEVLQSSFTSFSIAAVSLPCSIRTTLAGNLYNNRTSPALKVFGNNAIYYSDYHSYENLGTSWQIGEKAGAEVKALHDLSCKEIQPQFVQGSDTVSLTNGVDFFAGGTTGHPFGNYRLDIPREQLRLLDGPVLHSVSSTTANIEWLTSHPADTTLSWGSTIAVNNHVTFGVNYFGTLSLTGLTPNTTYYIRIDRLQIPEGVDVVADPVTVTSPLLQFTTKATDDAPRTYYVTQQGNNSNDGSSGAPWRSIQHAADNVNVGDQVIIGGGTYYEQVRIRATGAPSAPISFSTRPGEKVVLDGFEAALNQAFVISKKSHLRFDGFYFTNHDPNQSHSGAWEPHMGGQFNIYESRDIQISRVLSDGRYTGDRLFVAKNVDGLHISNSVDNNKLEGHYFENCPNLLMEHSVIARPMIMAFILRNRADEPSVFRDNIFTDMLDFKAIQNINIFQIDGSVDGTQMINNNYYVRIFSPAERHLVGTFTAADRRDIFISEIFADPIFQGAVDLINRGVDVGSFSPDRLMYEDVPFDFNTFFATNTNVLNLGIGLEQGKFTNGVPN